MRAVLPGLAAAAAVAIAVPAAPAAAQMAADPGFVAAPGASAHGRFDRDRRDGKRRDGRRHGRFDRTVVVVGGPWAWPEAWALYNNRSWEADSFNDWWHERPWRSYPRWMQHNQDCDRIWWGGGAWRC